MQKMKALVKTKPEPGGVEFLDWDIPKVGTREILIQVKAVGICGTDLHIYDWADNIVREYQPQLPLVMGHEFAGIVVELGSQVENLRAGDRVTVMPVLYCGECYFCRDGRQNICDHRPLLGLGANGAFAQFISVRSMNVFKLDDNVSFELGALSELTCVGLHAIERARLTSGETVVVVGPGPLGLMMTVLTKHSGAARIFITGLEADRERLEIAKQIGATPIHVEKEDPKKPILDYTGGLGADVVFETAGSSSGVTQSLNLVRKGGRVCILGQGHESTEIPTAMLSFREIELVGTRAYTPKNWQTVFHTLLNAADDLKRIITHRFPLYMAEDGIKKMKSQEGLKIILLP
jgi:2-desacetyl-2-hydroxyethyl bacteriochlorophyllide A dehydrogenase